MSKYKLTYFDFRGRGEIARFLFALGKLDYEDVRVDFYGKEWQELRPNTMFGQLPQLEVDGVTICQSHAIARFLAKQTGFSPKNDVDSARAEMIVDCGEEMLDLAIDVFFGVKHSKDEANKLWDEQGDIFLGYLEKFLETNNTGFLVGDSLTYADLSISIVMEWVVRVTTVDFKKFPRLEKLVATVSSQPEIAAWIQKRPVTRF